MGSRGPAQKPTALRILHGDRKDRINTGEPAPSQQDIAAPEWLTDEAREVWNRLAPDLEQQGVLTAWDADTFAILCDALVQYRHASRLVAAGGVLIKGRRDAAVKNPALQVVRDTAQTVRAYAQEFGLTPSARSGLSLGGTGQGLGPERLLS
ncbi:phage terminase small subunit P27 family [Kitasatospora sp. NPDC002965]|uniref:phage terminase small subunit P27 family n=1 Tax=Kitasatospora sp. NPDC002965 TaxID=3154775 RepID=UPI0033BCDE10